jgi:UDP-3-O-[3-hydroxymyristoyl] glucosamine N-acyltransferase
VLGDASQPIQSARPLGEAQAGDLTFIETERHLAALLSSPASAALVPASVGADLAPGKVLIQSADPLMHFAQIVLHLRGAPPERAAFIHPRAMIDPSVRLGPGASIAAGATVEAGVVIGARVYLAAGVVVGRDCRLGDDVQLHPNVVLYPRTILGNRVIIHAGSVIGADGFGYRLQGGRHVKVPQLGHVEIGDDVEIGACTTIDRGTFGATSIGAGTKIDNLVQIGHNCRIGRHNLLVSQLGIAGSSSTGDYVVLAGQVGVTDHVHIGDRTIIGAKAGVTKDIPPDQRMLGAPATPEREQKRILMSVERLPEMRQQLRRIIKHLGLDESDGATEAA